MTWWYLLLLWFAVNCALVIYYRRDLLRLWREPVLRHPVLIIESDDWGAGPLSQAEGLRGIVQVLDRHRDSSGHPPVFNLALVLAVPDCGKIRETGDYHRLTLASPDFTEILTALREGESKRVFSLQLHGMEHFWPETLMASGDSEIQAWLRSNDIPTTESLPSHLQSRWVNTKILPSTPHDDAAIRRAVMDEVRVYSELLKTPPSVVVPPTFVWTRRVEREWAEQGVQTIVTPGWRYTCRNAQGVPDCAEGPIVNGDAQGTINYLVRNDYFEPRRGRGADHALRALKRATLEGRPCLLENHRDNFIHGARDAPDAQHSLDELDKLYKSALTAHTGLCFMSTKELGDIFRLRDPRWLDTTFDKCLAIMIERLRNRGRLWKLATLTGLAGLAMLVSRFFIHFEGRR